MRRYYRAKSGFVRMRDGKLFTLANAVYPGMNNNSFFVDPSPSLEELDLVRSNFMKHLARARASNSPYDAAVKNEARRELKRVLRGMAHFVNQTANGSLIVLLSSGFEITRYRTRIASPERIRNLRVKDGRKAGQMVFTFQSQPSIRLYEYRYSTDMDESGEIVWNDEVHITTSSRNNLIAPVVPGQVYFLSARAINTRGIGDWSEPITWMAR